MRFSRHRLLGVIYQLTVLLIFVSGAAHGDLHWESPIANGIQLSGAWGNNANDVGV